MTERLDLGELFAKARGADIEAVAGVKLRRQGRRLRGPCPHCSNRPKAAAPAASGPSKRKRTGPSTAFSVDPVARLFKCFSCGEGGDVIALERLLRGGTPREAAERLAGAPAPASKPVARPSEPRRVEGEKPPSSAERLAAELWREASTLPIVDTPAARYLEGRGIRRELLAAVTQLRFHPAARWGWDEDRRVWLRAPAMVGLVRTPGGPTGGVHVTYLAADCSRKARLDPAKRMWGPQKNADGLPGCVWLSPKDAAGPLVVAEGIESAFSAAQLLGKPCRVAAALSLGALQGGWLTDKWGRIDPAAVTADPERPAFTWPDAGEVLVAVDRDMSPITVKVRRLGGGTAHHELAGDERARICAGLAVQAWRRAGAVKASAIAPAAGRDFNDELLGVGA